LLGGWIATEVGIRTTLWISALGGLLGVLWLLGLPRRSEAAGPAGVPLEV
jgi:predicted MFS family arabinose efflux permease